MAAPPGHKKSTGIMQLRLITNKHAFPEIDLIEM